MVLFRNLQKKKIAKMLTFPFVTMITVGTEDADKHDMKFQIQN